MVHEIRGVVCGEAQSISASALKLLRARHPVIRPPLARVYSIGSIFILHVKFSWFEPQNLRSATLPKVRMRFELPAWNLKKPEGGKNCN